MTDQSKPRRERRDLQLNDKVRSALSEARDSGLSRERAMQILENNSYWVVKYWPPESSLPNGSAKVTISETKAIN